VKDFINPWPEQSKIHASFYNKNFSLEKIKTALPAEVELVALKQIHGNRVLNIEDKKEYLKIKNETLGVIEADAAVTKHSRIALTVHTADCLPLLAYDENVIGSCHAGWRGLSNDIIENWIGDLIKQGARLEHLKIAIGPSIGPCHFEVGKDVSNVLSQIHGHELPSDIKKRMVLKHSNSDKNFIHLSGLALYRLNQLGILAKNCISFNECTHCNSEKYYSYRRDSAANGRLEGVIYRL